MTQKEKRAFFIQIFLDVILNIADLFFLAGMVWILNFYTQPIQLNSWRLVYEHFFYLPIVFFFAGYLFKNLAGYYILKAQYSFIYRVAARLSSERLSSYLSANLADFTMTNSAVHTHRINQRPIEYAHYILRGLQQWICQAILVAVAVIAIVFYRPQLFFLLLLILLPPVMVAGVFVKSKLKTIRTNAKVASESALQYLNEALAGFVESKLFSRKEFFVQRYSQEQSKLNNWLSDQQVVQNAPSRMLEVFALLGLTLLIFLNRSVSGSFLSMTTICAFGAAAYKIIPGIVKLMNTAGQIKAYNYVLEDLQESYISDIHEQVSIEKITSLQVKDLQFSYGTKSILNGFSLHLKSGDLVGVSGISGRGKTTLVNLLLGLLKPEGGEISVNGLPLTTVDHNAFLDRISYVKQHPFFIQDSALQNVVLGDKYDSRQLEKAAQVAGISSFTSDKTDAVIKQEGRNISGGQRQRLALARALYKDFDLLILDEPFSEMDEEAEMELLGQLRNLAAQGKMVLLITHNKNSLSYCSKTVFLHG